MGKSMNSIFSFLMIVFSCLALHTPSTFSSNNQTDLLSLLAMKKAIDVDPNGALNSWNRTTNFCRWNGITCGRRHPDRVVAINLGSEGLIGSLSPHIGNLSFLRIISLGNNSFNGRIPQEIGLLRRLAYIEFSNNSFLGSIPKNMSQCKSLVYLNLINNNLSGNIPPEIGLLYNLQSLYLGKNTFSGHIPQTIGNLTSLGAISLRLCGLIGEIPESFSRFRRLSFLQLAQNNLTGTILPGLFNISSIVFFGVDINRLQGSIPSNVGLTLPNMRGLHLGENQFSGHIPISLSNASSLVELLLADNHFSGPMPRFGELSNLRYLFVAGNIIEDDISFVSSLTNCTNIQGIDVGDNPFVIGSITNSIANFSSHLEKLGIYLTQIVGKIPSEIGSLVGLKHLRLSNNNLEGPIPLSIGRLFNLQILELEGNRLGSHIPPVFGNLTLLYSLSLERNNFSGTIPKSLANCTSMQMLDLSINNFYGPIPQEILISTVCILLDLSHNALTLTNSIPLEFGSLRNLEELDLSNNKLSGLIPRSLGTCVSLEGVYLNDNLFEGQIPNELSSLMGLTDLDLSRNNLSGSIPSFLGDLDLQNLNLSFNSFQGRVPTTGVFKNTSTISLEGNKELCGGILALDLPPCTSSSVSSKKKNLSTPLSIGIPIAGVAAILCFVLFIYKRRTPHKNMPCVPSFTGIPFLRLSYADLLKATSGFAETNLVGFGRFGSVYRGILEDGPTIIAVKVLNLVVKGASKSFMAECNALRNIRHRNLVKILSVCESIDFQENDFKALVYEFKAKGSLDKWLYYINSEQEEGEVRNLDVIERLRIAIDVAHALEYLHCGTDSIIIHGDLKPSNILLDEDMTACVGDFGLSKITSSIPESSSTIGIRGTFGYVPPEYGMSNSVSTKGDVYSYGILVLEMFTNRRPTDDSLSENGNLHNFVSAALPNRVMEIVDPFIRMGPHMIDNSKLEDCMCSIVRIGVSCSKELPRERMSMSDVVRELHRIQKELSS
ncbi:hypothetical protein ABFS83_02G091900 [Erythranthe nasuta]